MIGKLLAGLVLAALAAGPAAASTAWVQYGVSGRAEVRAVVDGACPILRVDGRRRVMTERAGPNEAFGNRVCIAAIPKGTKLARLGARSLALPKAIPNRLVIIGDTGCRLKGAVVQSCNDPAGWPFAKVAALAAAQKPDLVIHVGDYYYRETPCPEGDARCAGSPYGDKWVTWKAELFDPAQRLLATAPWVFARGNHEDCKRGGAGWFRLLDASPKPKACPENSDTYAVNIGGTSLFLIDSAETLDDKAPDKLVADFTARLDAMAAHQGANPVWIVTHHPIWHATRRGGEGLTDGGTNATQRAAVKGRDLKGVQMVLSGHVHNFTSLNFGSARPAQLIVGAGGDVMDPGESPRADFGAVTVDGLPAQGFTMGRFGYFVFDRAGKDWVGSFHDLTDAVVTKCRLHERELSCKAV